MKKIIRHWNIKNVLFLTLVLGIIILCTCSCEKIPRPYVKKWVGSYDCEEIYHRCEMRSNPNPPPPLYDTCWGGVYQTIVVIEAIGDSSLKITCGRNRTYETKVDRSGFGHIPLNHGFLEITFKKDSLKMTTRYGMNGYSASSIYKGKKLKTKKQ